jgi:tetratricopeptide (TPR) repeat protein
LAGSADPDPTVEQIYDEAQSGHLYQAQNMLNRVLRDHPNSARAHFVQAELYAREGKKSPARAELAKAEELAPGLPGVTPQATKALKTDLGMTQTPGKYSASTESPSTADDNSNSKSKPDGKTDSNTMEEDIAATLNALDTPADCRWHIGDHCYHNLEAVDIAARDGDANLQLEVGLFYEMGFEFPTLDYPKDYQAAFKWLSAAARHGLPQAESQLGYLYWGGNGVIQNWKEAVRLFHLAASQGDGLGQTMLCMAYGEGKGVQQNYVYAYMWCNIVVASGWNTYWNQPARDRLAAKMTGKQIADSQELARRCVESKLTDCGTD